MSKKKPETKSKDGSGGDDRVVAQNRKALHNYEIMRRMEAGLSLTGTEIKSIREGHASISEAYARPENGEVWLLGATIAQYASAGYVTHDPHRRRRLLLHKQEIRELAREVDQKGFTLIPLRLYLKHGLAKVELGLGRGRKQYDKREAIAKRESDRQIARALRRRE